MSVKEDSTVELLFVETEKTREEDGFLVFLFILFCFRQFTDWYFTEL